MEIEFTLAYWWIIEIVLAIIVGFLSSKSFSTFRKTDKFVNGWTISLVVVLFLVFIAPIKKDGTNKNEVVRSNTSLIQKRKQDIPKKVEDDSFQQGVDDVSQTITKEDIFE